MHCASACRAIHSCRRANSRSGTAAGFCAGHSRGCVRAALDKHSLLQNLAGQEGTFVDPGHGTDSEELLSGVEQ